MRGLSGKAPFIVSVAFFIIAVTAAGMGKYVTAVISLIAGLATLSYGVSRRGGGE